MRQQIHTDVKRQFPQIYREEGPIFVAFVEEYYKYMDRLSNNTRQAFHVRDIDTTLDRFLTSFRSKYMADFSIEDDKDFRFTLKHIQDLYSTKGTEESIKIFFRLFFDEDVDISYPKTNILKLSDSVYGSDRYLEMKPVSKMTDYPIARGDKITGTISSASAFVDYIEFNIFSGTIVPIVYISNLSGEFVQDDSFIVEGYRLDSQSIYQPYNATVFNEIGGSIDSIVVGLTGRTSGNNRGDIVDLKSPNRGFSGKAVITKVNEFETGLVEFIIEDGGYGYDANSQNNEYHFSTQCMTVLGDEVANVNSFANVSVANTTVTALPDSNVDYSSITFEGHGEVIKYDHPKLFIKSASNTALTVIPPGGQGTINIDGATSANVTVVSPFNDSATFTIEEVEDSETLTFVTDIISDFWSVTLDAVDYGMSGPSVVQDFLTPVGEAFGQTNKTVGKVNRLFVTSEGADNQVDVAVIVENPDIVGYDSSDFYMSFKDPDFVLTVGDEITQTRTYNTPFGELEYTSRGEYYEREGDIYKFRVKSVYPFESSKNVDIKGEKYKVTSYGKIENGGIAGKNGIFFGDAYESTGQITEVSVIDTGFRYIHGEEVEFLNSEEVRVGLGTLSVKGTGKTKGEWKTSTSMLNESTQVLHDNYYYQEYSYDISTLVPESKFGAMIDATVHVAGTKRFTTPQVSSDHTIDVDIDVIQSIEAITGFRPSNMPIVPDPLTFTLIQTSRGIVV